MKSKREEITETEVKMKTEAEQQDIYITKNLGKSDKCDLCGIKFSNKSYLKSHILRVHGETNEKKTFKCDVCNHCFTANWGLKKHRKVVHDGEKPFKCDICKISCPSKSKLSNHKSTVHEGKKPYECDICNKKFAIKSYTV